MRDQARLSSGANRFIAMAHRLTSYLEIRIRAPQYRELTAAYCIADDRAIVYRLRADRAEGIAGFNNPPIARQYLQEFDAVWQASMIEEREVRGRPQLKPLSAAAPAHWRAARAILRHGLETRCHRRRHHRAQRPLSAGRGAHPRPPGAEPAGRASRGR